MLHVLDCVDSVRVEVVLFDIPLGPVDQCVFNLWILLVQIWEVGKSAVHHLPFIVVIVNMAHVVVVFALGECLDA